MLRRENPRVEVARDKGQVQRREVERRDAKRVARQEAASARRDHEQVWRVGSTVRTIAA